MGQKEISRKIRKYFEQTKNKTARYKAFQDAAKSCKEVNCIALHACTRKEEKSQ